MKSIFTVSGFCCLAVLFLFSCGAGSTSSYLENPQDNDVILCKTQGDSPSYYFIKLFRVEAKRIYFYESPYFYKQKPKAMKLNDGFVNRAYYFDIDKWEQLKKQKIFLKVFRSYKKDSSSPYIKLFEQDEFSSLQRRTSTVY